MTEGDVGLGRSNIRSTVVAKLINDRQAERNLSSQVGISNNTVHMIFTDDLYTDL